MPVKVVKVSDISPKILSWPKIYRKKIHKVLEQNGEGKKKGIRVGNMA